MRVSDNVKPISGCLEVHRSMYNKRYAANEGVSKMGMDVHTDVSNYGGDKKRNPVTEKLINSHIKADYSVHKATNRIIIRLYNQKDGKLIKEIPEEKMLDLAAYIMESTGLLLDKRV